MTTEALRELITKWTVESDATDATIWGGKMGGKTWKWWYLWWICGESIAMDGDIWWRWWYLWIVLERLRDVIHVIWAWHRSIMTWDGWKIVAPQVEMTWGWFILSYSSGHWNWGRWWHFQTTPNSFGKGEEPFRKKWEILGTHWRQDWWHKFGTDGEYGWTQCKKRCTVKMKDLKQHIGRKESRKAKSLGDDQTQSLGEATFHGTTNDFEYCIIQFG